jgi:hypothetical protein
MRVVIQVRAGADDEVDQPSLHQLDDAAAETGRRQRAGDRQRNRRIVLRRQHLVREDVARFAEPSRVERLESLVDEVVDVGAPAGTVIANRLAGEVVLTCLARRSGRAVRHKAWRAALVSRLAASLASSREA